jgi:hypothetical protein
LVLQRSQDLGELRPGGAEALALSQDGGAWLTGQDSRDKVVTLARLDADGSAARLREEPAPGPYPQRTRLRLLPDGRLLMLGANLGLSVLDQAGGLAWRGQPAPANGAPVDVGVDAAGDWIVAQADGTILVRKLRPARDEAGAVRLHELWSRRVDAAAQSFPHALALTPAGDVLVAGELGVGSTRTPFVARINRDGQHQWTWTAPGSPLGGDFATVAVTRAGEVVAAGHLDRVEQEPQPRDGPVCPPEQTWCKSLYVVKLGGDGTFIWDYQHRSHHSEASVVLVDPDDRPLVLGWIDGLQTRDGALTVQRGLSVLRFAR